MTENLNFNLSQMDSLAFFIMKDRHNFYKVTDVTTFDPSQKDIFRSIYTHSEEIITYYNTHFNEKGNKTLARYSADVFSDNLIIDIFPSLFSCPLLSNNFLGIWAEDIQPPKVYICRPFSWNYGKDKFSEKMVAKY